MSTAGWLPEPKLMAAMERMSIAAKRRIRGTMQGKRRSKQLGASLEFADYRLYAPGDDIRRFDWNAYGRTGKPFIKQFLDEQELQVYLYVDGSRSMDFGAEGGAGSGRSPQTAEQGAVSKLEYARKVAACVGYIALSGYDRVSARWFGTRIERELPLLRGRGSARRLFEFLGDAAVVPEGDLASAIMRPASVPAMPGVAWVFSDFLFESGVEETLAYLQAARQEVVAVQILSPEELHPRLEGDLRLVDSESGTGKEVAVTGKIIKEYEAALRAYTTGIQRFCQERGIGYALLSTGTPIEETMRRILPERGLLI